MSKNTSDRTLPQALAEKVSAVLGVPSREWTQWARDVVLEELCDTALMSIQPDADGSVPPLGQVVAPVVKRVNAPLCPHRLARLRHQRPLRLVVGASGHFPPGWLCTEFETLNLLRPDDWAQVLDESSIDAILAEHVWEHLSATDGVVAARTCYRFLRPGGYVRVAVPDGLHPDAAYINAVRPGGSGAGADDHKVLYTGETFERVFQEAGFATKLLEYHDVDGRFQFTEWDPCDGFIRRSRRFDPRNQGGSLEYTSIILDAVKPG